MMRSLEHRADPAWYTPADLPAEFESFTGPVVGGLGAGAAGKVGTLDIALAPHNGVTRIERLHQRAPLHIYRPIYLDPNLPGMAFVYLQQFGDGLVQGDRYRIDVTCAPGTAAHVTTQAATKVFTSRTDYVTQLVNLRVAADAVLEYLPDPVVPFRGSRLFQRTCVQADPAATVIVGEVLAPGRVAHGEAHAYDIYWAETEVRRPDGALRLADVLRFNPGAGDDPRSIGLLGGYEVVGTLYVISERRQPSALVTLLRAALASCGQVLGGATELPYGCGAAVRLLGATSSAVQQAMRSAWSAARSELLGAPAPNLRKG